MGVSHQTVSFAKKVTKKGIPELAKLVESGDVAVSAAAMAVSHPADVQKNIVEKVEAEIKDGKNPRIAAIIRDIASNGQGSSNFDADKSLETLGKSLDTGLKSLSGIERIVQPENIVGIRATAQKIVDKLTEIETKSLDPGQNPSEGSVIEVKHFKALMDSIVPVNNQIRLKSDSDGMRVIAGDFMGKKFVDAFLPKESFAKYEELGEIALDASVTRKILVGHKRGMRIIVDPDGKKLHMTIGSKQAQQSLLPLEYTTKAPKFPDIPLACKIIVSGEEFVNILKSAKDLIGSSKSKNGKSKTRGSRYVVPDARFLLKDNVLNLLAKTLDNDQFMQSCNCRIVEQTGQANSRFNIDELLSIRQSISRSKEVTIGLGMLGPMTLELMIEQTKIRYYVDTLDVT